MLTEQCTRDVLAKNLLPRAAWRPYPVARDRAAWDALMRHPARRVDRAHFVTRAVDLLARPWPPLPATLYMEYARTGNRSHYEKPYFERRTNLSALALAECMEGQGRFLDEIVNGVWTILEETTWCLPAHATRLPGDPLHRLDIEGCDLFACETAAVLGDLYFLFETELKALSPALADRIVREIRRRTIDPIMAGDDFGRAGWLDGRNNWSPWCASNILFAAMSVLDDQDRLADVVIRLAPVVDRFIGFYGDDGGCDEGPGYWNRAAGAMFLFLELLRSRTGGALDFFSHPKIAAMGRFIVHAHIAGEWCVDFADASPKASILRSVVYGYGERIASPPMKQLALQARYEWESDQNGRRAVRAENVRQPSLYLNELMWIPAGAEPADAAVDREVWLSDLQVLFARETDRADAGLYLAAKGGHNAESHNHNDVGHFIVFLDGRPGIVDIGRGEYTAQTFGPRRYDLWFTRGLGHDAPVIGGVEQAPGRAHAARQVAFESAPAGPRLSMDIAPAYPPAARVRSLRREFELDRDRRFIRVSDAIVLDPPGQAEVELNLYAAAEPTVVAPGRIEIPCGPRRLEIAWDAKLLAAAVEPVPLDDPLMRQTWTGGLWRIALRGAPADGAMSCDLIFRAV